MSSPKSNHLIWPFTTKAFNELLDYQQPKYRAYLDQEMDPFEIALGKLLPKDQVENFDDEFKKVVASLKQSVPPPFDVHKDCGAAQFFVEMNGYDFTDRIPHLALVFGVKTEGVVDDLVHLILTQTPRVSIWSTNNEMIYQGILRPQYLKPELIAEATLGRYWVVVHEMVCIHQELGSEVFAKSRK